jgi:hypothetical protein
MSDKNLYRLADHTAAEALVDGWVAWPHEFSPVPYSLHMANYQIKTLASYLQNPEIHVKSSRNPKLLGGPFVDVPVERAPEVRALLNRLEQEHEAELELARTLTEFQSSLVAEATGRSINAFYRQIPESLGGYVELVYDYFSRPHVRCLENLFYGGPHYKPHLQSLSLFSQARDDSRAYYMSTPRLPEPDRIEWRVPFESGRIDDLFGLDGAPQPLGHIREILDLTRSDEERLLPLLTGLPRASPLPGGKTKCASATSAMPRCWWSAMASPF